MISLLITLLVFGLAYGAAGAVITLFPPPSQPRVRVVLYVILALIAIVVLLDLLGVYGGHRVMIRI